jgi:hypothetical protein
MMMTTMMMATRLRLDFRSTLKFLSIIRTATFHKNEGYFLYFVKGKSNETFSQTINIVRLN